MAIAMGWHKPDNVAGSSAPAIMVGSFVATGGLLFGYDTGTINGVIAMQSFLQQFHTHTKDNQPGAAPVLTPAETAIIVAILSAGTFVGALIAAPISDWIGRRLSLIVSVAIFCFGVIFQVCSDTIDLLLVGRFFAGVGIGSISVQVPLYQSEMAPKWIRGTLVCAYQLSITFGLLGASIVNVATSKMAGPAAYRIPLGLQFTWAVILAGGLLFLPETPRYLIKRGRKEEAGLALSRLRRLDITHPALQEELTEIEANHEYELTLGPETYREVFTGSPHLGRRALTGCLLQMLQQLTGINFIMYYGTTIFNNAGVLDPFLISLIMNIINVVSTIPGLFVVESWGRRRLLLVGAIAMAICQLIIAIVATVASDRLPGVVSKILLVFTSFFVFFYAASWGPVTWVVTSELFPLKIRAKAMSLTTSSNWLLNFGISYGTPYMVSDGAGYANMGTKVFYVWGCFCVLAAVFVYCMIYETSKISLEQIDEMYERVNFAWNSKKFEPSWSFQQLRDGGFANTTAAPPAEHELQPSWTGSSTTSESIETIHSDAPNEDTQSEEDKVIQQMGLGNVDFSY